jgi:hypothetical protein
MRAMIRTSGTRKTALSISVAMIRRPQTGLPAWIPEVLAAAA